MKTLLLALSLLIVQSPQGHDTASVEGLVVKLAASDPVARAQVVLSREGGPPSSLTALTDGGGKFTFQNLQAGRYRLSVTRDGYVRTEYGQRGAALAGTAITLAAGQEMRDVRITLVPTAAISGRVYDKYGDPVGNASVQALKYSYQEGRRVLTVVQSARTNDLGEYRMFWMQPGQYIVSAVPSDNRLDGSTMTIDLGPGNPLSLAAGAAIGGAFRVGGGLSSLQMQGMTSADTGETYLTVYYPGTTDASGAGAIDLRPGANFTGVDLAVVDARAVRIRGRVISSRPGPLAASVALTPRGTVAGSASVQRMAQVNDRGEFEFKGIAPGAYDLIASSGRQMIGFSDSSFGPGTMSAARQAFVITSPVGGGPPSGRAFDGGNNEPRLLGRVPVEVGNADIDNISIQLQQGFSLSGKIGVDGPAAQGFDLSNVRVSLRPDPFISQLASMPASVAANGTFTIADVMPGDYRITVSAMPRGGYVKSALLAGTDSSGLLLHVDGEPRGVLDILVGTHPGSLDANVQNEKQEAVPGITVVLVPAAARRQRSELYRSAISDASGRIHMDAVVPGDYKLFAWENVEPGAWQDPEFIRGYEDRGKAVRITEGGRELADVRVIP